MGVMAKGSLSLLVALVVIQLAAGFLPTGALWTRFLPNLQPSLRPRSSNVLQMATTYKPVVLRAPKSKAKSTILVKDGADDIIQVINSWTEVAQIDDAQVEAWMERGEAFWLTAQGTRAMHLSERREADEIAVRKPSTMKYAADFYRNVGGEGEGDEVVLVSAASSTKKADLASGLRTVEEMEASGRAYRNISQLLVDRAVLDRADDIAVRVRDDFPLASDTWSRWTNATEKYKETSLTQVMSEYFKDHSIGDCGGSGDDYTPLPGYPGTLAPGTQFEELYSLDKLSRKILHPWPAMQAYQWHVRQPQAHPMIAPPLLWFALNDMYTANFTATQLEQKGDSNVIVGGSNMNPVDAIRIARSASLGRPYDPAVQVQHGGMIFTGGHDIPNYNPDHGPTYDDAEPPIPEELKFITERWFDPMKALSLGLENGLDPLNEIDGDMSEEEVGEVEDEQEVRRVAAQRLLDRMYPSRAAEQQQRAELELAVRATLDADAGANGGAAVVEGAEGVSSVAEAVAVVAAEEEKGEEEEEEEEDEEDLLATPNLSTRNIQRGITQSVISGQARSRRSLIKYTVNTIRDMQAEIILAERDLATRKKSGRRKQRKTKKDESEEDNAATVEKEKEKGKE